MSISLSLVFCRLSPFLVAMEWVEPVRICPVNNMAESLLSSWSPLSETPTTKRPATTGQTAGHVGTGGAASIPLLQGTHCDDALEAHATRTHTATLAAPERGNRLPQTVAWCSAHHSGIARAGRRVCRRARQPTQTPTTPHPEHRNHPATAAGCQTCSVGVPGVSWQGKERLPFDIEHLLS